jgi:hypothetical protein
LRGEAPDLTVKVLEFGFVHGFDRRSLAALIEERGQPLEHGGFPLAEPRTGSNETDPGAGSN